MNVSLDPCGAGGSFSDLIIIKNQFAKVKIKCFERTFRPFISCFVEKKLVFALFFAGNAFSRLSLYKLFIPGTEKLKAKPEHPQPIDAGAGNLGIWVALAVF